MQVIQGIPVWGTPDEGAVRQMQACAAHGNVAGAALMADHHLGYSQPIGGVIAYRDAVSPSGVGYDIGCGVLAVRTDMTYGAVRDRRATIADDIARSITFGVGSGDGHERDHAIFEDPAWRHLPYDGRTLERTARQQLGSVGSGNHYVDLLVEEGDTAQPIWVAAHFGSRGFGHRTATGFLNVAAGRPWNARPARESMDAPPTLIEHAAEPGLFDHYLEAMRLAGDYARAGRELVVDQVLRILGATATAAVHNHHNYAWLEEHGGENVWVVRKGATPAFPGQQGFVGGSMGDIAAVVEGVDSDESVVGLRSTVHGAGRVMSRGQAKGSRPKRNLETGRQRVRRPGLITRQMMSDATQGVEVRGGDVDESPHVYRKLAGVLDAHAGSIAVRHVLRPVVVVMADARVRDSVPTD